MWAGGDLQTTAGFYVDSFLTDASCDSVIETTLQISNPQVDLGNDTSICEGQTISLNAGTYTAYEWSDGSFLPANTFGQPGVFWVVVTDDFDCQDTDTLKANDHCPFTLYVPNAFSPNGDGRNDLFRAYGKDLHDFHLTVFNRWGELVFESFDLNDTWDGAVNGQRAQGSVFVWKIDFRAHDGETDFIYQQRFGSVTLLE